MPTIAEIGQLNILLDELLYQGEVIGKLANFHHNEHDIFPDIHHPSIVNCSCETRRAWSREILKGIVLKDKIKKMYYERT